MVVKNVQFKQVKYNYKVTDNTDIYGHLIYDKGDKPNKSNKDTF